MADDFNDSVRDTAKWDLGIFSRASTYVDPLVNVAEQNGSLSIALRSNVSINSYNGYVSTSAWSAVNSSVMVEVVQRASGGAVTIFSMGIDKDNWYSFRAKSSSLILETRVNGTTTSVTIPYDATQFRFWRLRHDQVADTVLFETSPDGNVWTARQTVARQFSLSAVKFELIAGTGSSIAVPGSAIFDNFQLASN